MRRKSTQKTHSRLYLVVNRDKEEKSIDCNRFICKILSLFIAPNRT